MKINSKDYVILQILVLGKCLKPEIYFSPSQASIISWKYSALNKYVAQPTFGQIVKFLKNEKYKIFDIAGGGSITKNNQKWIQKKGKFEKDFSQREKLIKKYSNKKYYYSKE